MYVCMHCIYIYNYIILYILIYNYIILYIYTYRLKIFPSHPPRSIILAFHLISPCLPCALRPRLRSRIHAAVLIHQLLALGQAEVLLQAAEIHRQQDLIVLVVTRTLAGQQGVTANLLAENHGDAWRMEIYEVNVIESQKKEIEAESRNC